MKDICSDTKCKSKEPIKIILPDNRIITIYNNGTVKVEGKSHRFRCLENAILYLKLQAKRKKHLTRQQKKKAKLLVKQWSKVFNKEEE